MNARQNRENWLLILTKAVTGITPERIKNIVPRSKDKRSPAKLKAEG
jgi:hypothetical protein